MQTELLLVFLLSIIIVVSGVALTAAAAAAAAAAFGTLDKTSTMTTLSPSRQALADFNFAAVGDWGCTSHTIDTVNNIQDKKPELVLGLGDYSYNKTTADCWLKTVDPIDEIMKISIGNHDDETSSSLREYMSHFNLTHQYYSFNYQNVHFTVISTELPYEVGSKQYNFINNDLSKAAADP